MGNFIFHALRDDLMKQYMPNTHAVMSKRMPAMLEGSICLRPLPKPRIYRELRHDGWWWMCSCDKISAYGGTPAGAYERWHHFATTTY